MAWKTQQALNKYPWNEAISQARERLSVHRKTDVKLKGFLVIPDYPISLLPDLILEEEIPRSSSPL